MFDSISDMGLKWRKLIISDSGWVSDNYLGYARVIKWIYHPISILQSKEGMKGKYVEPHLSVEHWYVKICKD